MKKWLGSIKLYKRHIYKDRRPVFSIPLTLMFVHHDHFTQVCEKLYISQASVSWEWSVNGISELQISLASRTSFNVSIYICKNVFLIKIRK